MLPVIMENIGNTIGTVFQGLGGGSLVDTIVNGLVLVEYLISKWETVTLVVLDTMKLGFLSFGVWLGTSFGQLLVDGIRSAVGKMLSAASSLLKKIPGMGQLGEALGGAGGASPADRLQEQLEIGGRLGSNIDKLQGGWGDFLDRRKAEIATPFGSSIIDKITGKKGERFSFDEAAGKKSDLDKPELQFAKSIERGSDDDIAIRARFAQQGFDANNEKAIQEEQKALLAEVVSRLDKVIEAFHSAQIPVFVA